MCLSGLIRVWDNFLGQGSAIVRSDVVSILVGLKKPCPEQLQRRKGLRPTKVRTRQYLEVLTKGICTFEIRKQLGLSREEFTALRLSTGILRIPLQASLMTRGRLWHRPQVALPSHCWVWWYKDSFPSPAFAKQVLCNTKLRQTHPPCGVSHLNVTPWNFLCRSCSWYSSVAHAWPTLKWSRIHLFSSCVRCTTDHPGFILLWQGGWTRWPTEVPSNPYASVI